MERQAVAIAALEFHGEEPKVQELERRIQKLLTANYKSMESQDKLIPVKQRFKISYETEM